MAAIYHPSSPPTPTPTSTTSTASTASTTSTSTTPAASQPQSPVLRNQSSYAHSSNPAAIAFTPTVPIPNLGLGLGLSPSPGSISSAAPLPPARTSSVHAKTSFVTGSRSSSARAQKPAGLLAFAVAALDRTITNRVEPLRNRQSSSTLDRLSIALESPTNSDFSNPDRSSKGRILSGGSSVSSTPVLLSPLTDTPRSSQASLEDPISTPYSETDANQPPPILLSGRESKMHQTSSRLLRMTDDDRPFTRDFKDLFSTLIVSLLPLSPHRVRLTRVEHTFLSEDAINNLGSLKFSQSNRMPDPKDPTRIVTTTTTTTFSMAKDMARSICQRFLDARFIESADERDPSTDKLVMDRGTMEVVFRRLCGANGGLNIKSNVNTADSDSLSDYRDGLTGVKMASERKLNGKIYKDTFTGKACSDWLMDCCTTVDRRETYEMASLFVEYELMESIQPDRAYMATSPSAAIFQPTKNAIYHLTTRGKEILTGTGRGRTSESEGLGASGRPGVARDSNTQRLDKILNDAALRLLFRENLRETHCEENLSFYLDVEEFVRSCCGAIKSAQKNPTSTSMDGIKEIMAQAYGIYNAFLAPGSPCELNIDHQLRSNLATRMTKAVGQDVAMIDTLHEVMALFEDAQNAVFKLMASDSVPKFLRNAKYEHTLKNYDFDSIVIGGNRGPERSHSRSNRR
ncbi:hypothetical protein EKO27_g2482 [Xylaria grammica]|uniref:RGS domain-containing protein n=1 Tax=Xylaria grammica TaxID=363999 RepID=A0A439DE28_9PEZI|nr:hypothetical protein EKO27_g2482 [Xylaria grammica]